MKRIVLIGALFLSIAIISLTFLLLKNKQQTNISAWQVIPNSPTLILKINQFSKFLQSLRNNTYFTNINTDAQQSINILSARIDSLLQKNKSFKPFMTDSALFLVIYTHNKSKQFNWLAIASSNHSSKRINILISELIKILNEAFYLNHFIQIYYYHKNGLLVIGDNKDIINKSYQQLFNKKSTLLNDTSFLNVLSTSGKNAQINLYLNIHRISDKAVDLFNTTLQPRLKLLLESFNWFSFDIQILPEYINFNGFGNQLTPKTCWANVFSFDTPTDFYDFWIFPTNMNFFTIYNINDNYYFKISLKNKLKGNPSIAKKIEKFQSDSTLSLQKIVSLLNHSICRFSMSDSSNRIYNYWTIKTNSTVDAHDWLTSISYKKTASYISTDSSASQIFQLKIKNLPNLLFGEQTDTSSYQYALINREYIVFASNISDLNYYYSQKKKLLISDTIFKSKCLNLFATRSNFFFYTRTDRSVPNFYNYVNNNNLNFFEKYIFLNAPIYGGFQLSNNSNMLYANGFIYSPLNKLNNNSEKKISFDTTIVNIICIEKPDGTYSNYIGVQDAKYKFTILNKTGQKLATIKTEGVILGNPKIIQLQNNEWIVFNTKHQLYMIDPTGKFKKGYPVQFKSKATNGLQIADFDNNHNYRIYLAFENKKFVALDTEANRIKGWKFKTTDDLVIKPAICFTYNKKDYIIAFTKTNLYILDRQGEFRFKPELFSKFNQISQVGVDFKNAYFRILIANRQNLYALYPDYQIEQLTRFGEKNKIYFSDDLHKAISISNKDAEIISFSAVNKIDLKNIPIEPDTAFVCKDNTEYYYLINSLNEKKLILYNENGKYIQTFSGHYPLLVIPINTNFKNILIFSNSKQLIMSKFTSK